ncbi:hypothetical protein L1787_05695 [Acuticoccus sp. M5D2P5]|uniref:hypothetical protein n=1 Tax=Acuticoccus kalidii TaxID=2910977 RepID=UPI001F309EA9|nr:hypothetical protein [Acuticoccus kalidii]MCF3932906.1 hypothetical protein [Acuticoccus kalidii]
MKIAIVIPSAAFAQSAGARIRYQRIIDAAARGTIEMIPLEAAATSDADAFLFSKTYQSAAPALAYSLAAKGKRVALDIFDDYFSDTADTRMARFRHWFDEMARAVHHVTVSTPALAARLAPRLATPPTVIADPAAPLAPEPLAERLAETAARIDPDALDLLWFGIASNPYFEAGLADLAAFAPSLAPRGSRHRLTVLTNATGASEAALAALSNAPVPITWEAWSEAREAALLATADVAILPVGYGPFSTAKSLNRATTALAAGAQVLSLGPPLYAPLDRFLYRRIDDLTDDARLGRLHHRASRAAWFTATLGRLASGEDGARRLLAIFEAIRPTPLPPHIVIAGSGVEADLLAASGALILGFEEPADILVGNRIQLHGRAAERLGVTLVDPATRGLPTPPPLSGHGVVDLVRTRARFTAARRIAEALLPDHTVFLAHDGIVAP